MLRAWVGSLALCAAAACHHAPPPISVAPLPASAYSHYLAGKMALYSDDFDDATRELSAAAAAAPDQPMITVELARALAKAKREDAAVDVLALARKKWPEHGQVWLASGEVLENAAKSNGLIRKDAVAAYKRAIKLEPTEERGYLGLARTQEDAGDHAGSEKTLRELVAKRPDSVDGHYRLAQRLDARGEREAAIVQLRAVLEWEPDHLDARMDLARTLRRMGKNAEAVEQARSAFDRAGQPMDLAEELYWLLCEADDRQGAIDLLTLLDDDRSDADALSTVSALQRGLGRTPEARLVAEHIKPLDPDEATIAFAMADLAEGLTKDAIDKLETIPAASQHYGEARRTLITAYLAAHEPDKALPIAGALRAVAPDNVEASFPEALVRAELGDRTAASILTDLQGDPMTRAYDRARVLDKLGDQRGAIAALEPFLGTASDNAAFLNFAGYLLAQQKTKLDVAEKLLRKARDLQPGDPAILDSWGYLRLQQGHSREAVIALDHASRFAPREPEILVHLAEAWAADGAPRRAAETLDRASALNPSPDVAKRIDAIRARLAIR